MKLCENWGWSSVRSTLQESWMVSLCTCKNFSTEVDFFKKKRIRECKPFFSAVSVYMEMQVRGGTAKARSDERGSGGVCWGSSCTSSSLGSLAGAEQPCHEQWNGQHSCVCMQITYRFLFKLYISKQIENKKNVLASHCKESFPSLLVFVASWSHCLCRTAGLKTSSWPTCTQSCRWSKRPCRNTRTSLRLAFLRAPTSSPRLQLPTTTSEVDFCMISNRIVLIWRVSQVQR